MIFPDQLTTLLHDETGQDLVEYALMIAIMGLGAVASIQNVATSVSNIFTTLGTTISSTS